MKAVLIPESILRKKKSIEESLKRGDIGIFHLSTRRCGNTYLRNLIFNTEDAEVVETKQLTDKTKEVIHESTAKRGEGMDASQGE